MNGWKNRPFWNKCKTRNPKSGVWKQEFFMTNFYRFIFGLALVWLWQAAIAETSMLKVRGRWEQGGILFGQVAPGSQVRFAERVVRVTDTGNFVIGHGFTGHE